MRLAPFILSNIDPILAQWETFARDIWPKEESDPAELRDHAAEILRATAADMQSEQSAAEQSDKSQGKQRSTGEGRSLDRASTVHAIDRLHSGLDLISVIAEYRALRASVIRLWQETNPAPDARERRDIIRFNESIDQSLTEAIRAYTEELEHSRRMFLAILGHDLRNPLNAVRLSADALQQMCDLDSDCAEYASQITSSTDVMTQMVSDLLDFTLTSLGRALPLAPAPVDLKALCDDVVDEFQAAYPDADIQCHLHGDLSGQWDKTRLRQALSNLLGNALQHGDEGQPVDLSITGKGPEVLVAVHNGGAPIAPDELPTLFDPLVRGSAHDAGGHRSPGGTGSIGLGLYIAQQIALAHGGTVDATSTADAGTTFTLRLPRGR